MTDFDDLRVFERVAALRSFSAAARALGLPKASVSRAVGRLESRLGVRLLQRTTRAVAPTEAGEVLRSRSTEILQRIGDTFAAVGSLNETPRGHLRISAGIGFGINVLSEMLPAYVGRYPEVEVSLDLTSRSSELVGDSIDVAIRMGPLPNSSLVAVKLGAVGRCLCASPDYLARRGTPLAPADLAGHDLIEMPGAEGRPRPLVLADAAGRQATVLREPRIAVNDALTVHRLVRNGAGVGGVPGYLGAPDIEAGTLVRLLPGWRLAAVEAHAVFPSNRALAPAVRAFVDLLKGTDVAAFRWREGDGA